jgi:hypothetical protein
LASRAGAAWGWPGEGALIGCARLAPAASAALEPAVTSDSTTACLAWVKVQGGSRKQRAEQFAAR